MEQKDKLVAAITDFHGQAEISPFAAEGVTIPDRPKTPYEQRWDNLSDLQKMQLQGLLEHYSNEYITAAVQSR